MSKRNARREFTYQVHKAGRAIYEAGELAERERIIALLESKLMGKAVSDLTGEIGWSSFEGDVIALIKGENNV